MDPRKLTPTLETIHQVCSLPLPLAEMIQSYACTATQAIVDEVNQDINKLRIYQHIAWDGQQVMLSRNEENSVDLSNTNLVNISFTNPADYSELSRHDQLFKWFNSPLRKKYNYKYANFIGTSLINAKFEDMFCTSFFFSLANLKHASFKGSILTEAIFLESNAQYADLSHCYGSSFVFHQFTVLGSDLRYANIQESQCDSCFIHETLLDDANLSNSSFNYSTLSHCSLERANLTSSQFQHTNFRHSNLNEVNFSNANLINASFSYASMENAKLDGAIFYLSQFSKEQVLSFHYDDPHAREYIKAIYEFKEQNPTHDSKQLDKLILSFIHTYTHIKGKNKALAKFIDTGILPGEPSTRKFFTHQHKHPLHKRFLEIHASHHPSLLPRIRSLFSRP